MIYVNTLNGPFKVEANTFEDYLKYLPTLESQECDVDRGPAHLFLIFHIVIWTFLMTMILTIIKVMGPKLARNIGLQYQQITVQRVVGSESDAAS